jgi:hypothetical protein
MRDPDSSTKWWEEESADPMFCLYKMGDTEVLVGPSPDSYGFPSDQFKTIDAWLSVNDRFLEYPAHTRNYWFPWPVNKEPSEETIFGVVKSLHYWIDELKLKRVYIHCLHGLQRAPTVFACYLYAYHKNEMKTIINSVTIHGYGNQWCSPLSYLDSYFEASPRLPFFLEEVAKTDQRFYLDSVKTSLLSNVRINVLEKKLKIKNQYYHVKFLIKESFHDFLNVFKKNKVYLEEDWNTKWMCLTQIVDVYDDYITVDVFGQAELKINKKDVIIKNPLRPKQMIQVYFLRHRSSHDEKVVVRPIGY